MHVYKVEVDQRSLGYYEAESKNAARVAALKHVTVERIDSSEVIKLMKRGIAISSAATGQCINGDAEAFDAELGPEFAEVGEVDESQEVLPFDGEDADDTNRELGG